MPFDQVPANFSAKDIVLTPLDGVNTKAATKLRQALRDYVQVVGKPAVKALLTALAAAN